MASEKQKPTGLALLREPFAETQISILPQPMWKKETYEIKGKEIPKGNCSICGGYHYIKGVVHLNYVGHAALTDRLLDCDANWNWEPMAFDDKGQPLIVNNTLWIRLTVCGVTRLGFGDAAGKTGANAIKEIIGDALRNAAMRFGAALDLWHKGDLHAHRELKVESDDVEVDVEVDVKPKQPVKKYTSVADFNRSGKNEEWITGLDNCATMAQLLNYWLEIVDELKTTPAAENIENRAVACAKTIINNISTSELVKEDRSFNLENLKLVPFWQELNSAYIARGQFLTNQTTHLKENENA